MCLPLRGTLRKYIRVRDSTRLCAREPENAEELRPEKEREREREFMCVCLCVYWSERVKYLLVEGRETRKVPWEG